MARDRARLSAIVLAAGTGCTLLTGADVLGVGSESSEGVDAASDVTGPNEDGGQTTTEGGADVAPAPFCATLAPNASFGDEPFGASVPRAGARRPRRLHHRCHAARRDLARSLRRRVLDRPLER